MQEVLVDIKKAVDDAYKFLIQEEPHNTDIVVAFVALGREIEKATEKIKKSDWHIVTYHDITDEEREREGYPEEWVYYIDCPMPCDEQEILIVTKHGGKYYIDSDTCCLDGCDGYYLDSGIDWTDVVAWREMPEFNEKYLEEQ